MEVRARVEGGRVRLLQHGEHHRGLAQLGEEEGELRQVRLDALLVPPPRGPLVGPLDARLGAYWLRGGLRAAGGVPSQDAVHVREAELHQHVEHVACTRRAAAWRGCVVAESGRAPQPLGRGACSASAARRHLRLLGGMGGRGGMGGDPGASRRAAGSQRGQPGVSGRCRHCGPGLCIAVHV